MSDGQKNSKARKSQSDGRRKQKKHKAPPATAAEPSSGVAEKPPADDRSEAGSAAAAPWTPAPIAGGWLAAGLALCSAVLYWLAFPGMDLWPLAFVSQAPLILALHGQTPRRATLLGWLSGLAATLLGFFWLVDMLATFSGFPTPLCILFVVILNAYQGGRMALCAWLYARAAQRGWPPALVFAFAFAASELLFPVLFPWYLGACLHDVPVLLQLADIGGPILLSLVVLAPSLALAELGRVYWLGRRIPAEPGRHRPAPSRLVLAAGLAAPLCAAGYGLYRTADIEAQLSQSKPLKVGLVQGNQKMFQRGNALQVHVSRTRQLKAEQAIDLAIWSEAAVPGRFTVEHYPEQVKRAIARHLGVPTIIGSVLHEPIANAPARGRRHRYFNTALMADAQGNITGRYDKQFLLMFGEYLPFGDTFPILYEWSPHSGNFSPGSSFAPLLYEDHPIAVNICYEDIIPGFISQLVKFGRPELLVNITNDTWFGDTAEPWQHLALAKLRAVEHHLFLIRVTNTGVSAIVDPTGRVRLAGPLFEEASLVGEVSFMKISTIFQATGNVPWWLLSLLVIAACFIRRPRSRLSKP